MRSVLKLATLASVIIASGQFIACSGSDNNPTNTDAGTSATGGLHTSGGASSSAGAKATGGTKAAGGGNTGGIAATGGNAATGGAKATGGASASTGGAATGGAATGGAATNGGNSSTGGSKAAGGTSAAGASSTVGGAGGATTGGVSGTGGSKAVGGTTSTSTATGGAGGGTTGGASGTGGSNAVGGTSNAGGNSSTAGTSSAVGGAGGAATGGVSATGGTSSAATGGTAADSADVAILRAHSADCATCALANCANYIGPNAALDAANGFGSCFTSTVTALSLTAKVSTTVASDPYPITVGTAYTGDKVCLDVLSCMITSKCASAGVVSNCYCGAAVGGDCIDALNYPPNVATNAAGTTFLASDDNPANGVDATGPINGACFLEEIDGRNSSSPSAISGGFGNPAFALGPANQLVTCLVNKSCTACF